MTELFDKNPERETPLAAKLAPQNIEDFAGQHHILSEGKLLRRLIAADKIRSALFFGPPGCGKTALARFIAARTKAKVHEINAAVAGIADLKQVLAEAKDSYNGQRILVILDEIHHFNRTQQDVLLPSVEKGDIILIGLTTENPFFYINSALISRFSVFEFKPLAENDLKKIILRAAEKSSENGVTVEVTPDAINYFATNCGGDARKLLNAFELALLTTKPADGKLFIDIDTAQETMQRRAVRYDKSSDEHYDHISAFIKSMRGSDPDAAVYWMAKMIAAGEDPRFIARRVLICAAEDVGNADPVALMLAETAFRCVEMLGMPEARIPLAEAVTYVACAPKSNAAYLAIDAALAEVQNGPVREVPLHLRDASRDGDAFGHGKGYQYPHDFPHHYVKQVYMPNPKTFYNPTRQGREAAQYERLQNLRALYEKK